MNRLGIVLAVVVPIAGCRETLSWFSPDGDGGLPDVASVDAADAVADVVAEDAAVVDSQGDSALDAADSSDVVTCDGAPCPVAPISLALGGVHSCAQLSDSTLDCWGGNSTQQLGYVTTDACGTSSLPCRTTPAAVPSLRGVTSVAGATDRTCVALSDGTARCWGADTFGQTADSSTSTSIPGLANVVQLTAGYSHTCARLRDGSAMCWGTNTNGELGASTTVTCHGTPFSYPCTHVPLQVVALTNVADISAGGGFTCAVLTDHTVRCWGDDSSQQLGGSSLTNPVMGISTAVQVVAGRSHVCALLTDHTVFCWGANSEAQLGAGATGTTTASPSMVPGLTGVSRLAAYGDGDSTCALLTGGTVECWGSNASFQLSGGGSPVDSPRVVAGVTAAIEIALGGSQGCARLRDSSIVCWGTNDEGQIGDGSTMNRPSPVPVLF